MVILLPRLGRVTIATDEATARLFKHDNHALAMEKEARKHRRLKARKEWKAAQA